MRRNTPTLNIKVEGEACAGHRGASGIVVSVRRGAARCAATTCNQEARTWVGVCEQRADGQQHLGHSERRAPLILQNVEADAAAAVDVAVVDACLECDLQQRTVIMGAT